MLLLFWEVKENSLLKKKIAALLKNLEKKMGKKKNAKVIFTNGKTLKKLNNDFRGKNRETDVLSFREEDLKDNCSYLKEKGFLGEIYINYDWIKKKSKREELLNKLLKERQNSKEEKVLLSSLLFIHGFLHLLGFDHDKDSGEMNKEEKKWKLYVIRNNGG